MVEGKDGFPILERKLHNGYFAIHLICSPGEGSNILENRFLEARRDHRSSWGAYTRQSIMVCRVAGKKNIWDSILEYGSKGRLA